MLDGSNVSVQLTTSVTLTPPKPEIAGDNLIPLNATDSQKVEAFEPAETPHFPPLEESNPRFRPVVTSSLPEHWDTVAKAWETSRPEAESLVRSWSQVLFWNPDSDSQKLSAVSPSMFISKRADLWMRAPSLGVMATKAH